MQNLHNSKVLFCFFLLYATLNSIRVQGISMRCISIGSNGGVTVTWDAGGTNPGDFYSWYVFHSTNSNGPFTAIDSIFFYNDTNTFHGAANAANNPAYYFIVFKSNSGAPDIFSDTIRAIGLNLSNPGSGYATLSWNATHYPLIGTHSPYYLIYREYPAGILTLIDSVDARTAPIPMIYADTITICDDTIKYRVEVRDVSGCTSVSYLRADRFADRIPPAVPVIDSVSVDASGHAIVSWFVDPANDTRAYVILQYPAHSVVDTVYGRNSTTLSTTIDATIASRSFEILAIDSCNNQTQPSPLVHSTIYLNAIFDACSRSGILNWTAYDFWGLPPNYYIYSSVNGGPETLLDSTTQTFYNDTNLTSGSTYCYRVQAKDSITLRTSTSNRECVFPSYPPLPSYSYIRKVSVIGEDRILVVAYVDPGAQVKGYELYRSKTKVGGYSKVGERLVTGVSTVSFTDVVSTSVGPYYYFVSTLDSCGNGVRSSQISQSIFLSGTAAPEFINYLDWTHYAQWPNGVNRYNIYSVLNGNLVSPPFITLLSADSAYVDTVTDSYYSNGEFCYVIEAIEAVGNPYFFLDSSRSNVICLKQEPVIFIPNAFHPGGHLNEIFYPSNGFVSQEGYSLDIYNRWGELIFHTEDPLSGWSGVANGKSAPEGVYVYRLKAKTPGGVEIDKVGSVTLIR